MNQPLNQAHYFAREQALPPVWDCCMVAPLRIVRYRSGDLMYVCPGCERPAVLSGCTATGKVSLAKRQTREQLVRAFHAAYAAFEAKPTRGSLYAARLAYQRTALYWVELTDLQYLVLCDQFDRAEAA